MNWQPQNPNFPGIPAQQPQPGYAPPQGYGQPQYAPQPMPGPPPPQMPPPPAVIPQTGMPDADVIAAAFARAQEQQERGSKGGGGGGPKVKFFSPAAPNGETNWTRVPVGTRWEGKIWICPPPSPAPGEQVGMFYLDEESHFWQGQAKPQRDSVPCLGDGCPVCKARTAMFRNGDAASTEHAREHGKVQKKAIYQILLLDHPEYHLHDDGQYRPLLLRVGNQLQESILRILKAKSPAKCIDPTLGRPFLLSRAKTGPQPIDVKWEITDCDPEPLNQYYWPLLSSLHDLRTLARKPPGRDAYVRAIQDMRFPFTQEVNALLGQMMESAPPQQPGQPQQPGYSPHANPPMQSPYPQQGQQPNLPPHLAQQIRGY